METDLLLMTLCIFLPSVFAIALMFFPKGSEEYMRWFALFGTAVTLVISLVLFIDYLAFLDANPAEKQGTTTLRPSDKTTLTARAANTARERVGQPRDPDDLISRHPWISRFNIDYFVGIDGISMPLLLLTTVLFFLSMIASWNIEKYTKGYCVLFLVLETGVIGTFLALDFFLFYIFWEIMLLPMYFLIGVWGGPRREYAAIKFFLFTLFGSVFILIAMLGFYFTDVRDFVDPSVRDAKKSEVEGSKAGQRLNPAELRRMSSVHTFDLMVLHKVGRETLAIRNKTPGNMEELARAELDKARARRDALTAAQPPPKGGPPGKENPALTKAKLDVEVAQEKVNRFNQAFFLPWFQYTMFLFLLVGFAIKIPVFPFHTWLPDAHVEAPTPISMILAGILLKLGGYGIIRIAYPICPWAAQELALAICVFAMINIVYGAFAAMAQTDFKKLVAYSSISHMGYVLLGIAVWSASGTQAWSWGMNGAMYQMIGHGISSAGMFFLVGVIYDRAHHRNLDNFRGLYEPMPLYGGMSAVIFFAALGLPGLCGFVGEFMVVLSTWNFAPPGLPYAGRVLAILAALTVVITAAYILWTLQRVYLGTNPAYKDYPDITVRELLCVVPLVILAVVLGILPSLILNWMEPHVTDLVDSLASFGRY
jgi:NADH-quinone oxidoreductase subunit M